MNIRDIIKALRNNTTILHETFQREGLRCEKVGYGAVDEDGRYNTYVEISGNLKKSIAVVVNCYDYCDELIYSERGWLFSDRFKGYATLNIYMNDEDLLARTERIKIFVQ